MTDVVYPHLDRAREIVREEFEIAEREVAAFEAFRKRLIRHCRSTVATAGATGTGVQVAEVALEPSALSSAYRETVMATSHFDREYGEPLVEHAEAEWGPSVAALFRSDRPLAEFQLSVVLRGVDEAIDRRDRFRTILERERESLTEVEDRLGEIEQEFHRLVTQCDGQRSHKPGALEPQLEACERLAGDRQRRIHRRTTSRIAGIGDQSLVSYLYRHGDQRFPALAEIAEVASRIRRVAADDPITP